MILTKAPSSMEATAQMLCTAMQDNKELVESLVSMKVALALCNTGKTMDKKDTVMGTSSKLTSLAWSN
jgi:hypothetical protein